MIDYIAKARKKAHDDSQRDDCDLYFQTYNSMTDLVVECDKAWKAGRQFSGMFDGGTWTGRPDLNTWENVKRATVMDWKEGLDIVQQMLWAIEGEGYTLPPPIDRRRRKVWSDNDGDDIELDRLRNGQDFWLTTKRVRVLGPQLVTLVINTVTAGSVNADDILWRGAAGIVIADMLEKAGYSVEVWASDWCKNVFTTYSGPLDHSLVSVCLKRAGDPVDISNMVNGVSGWFYRTILGFQSLDIPHKPKRRGYGAPMPMDTNTPAVQRLKAHSAKLVVVDGVWNFKDALNKVREIIEATNQGAL